MTNVRLFAEMIYGMVVHSQVPKRETIDLISEQIAKYFPDAEPVRDSYKLPEPRTCETCATGCLPNERVYVNPDVETPCPGWTPRSPQSADVETMREALTNIHDYGIDRDGETTSEKLGELVDELVQLARDALAATATKET